MTAQWYYAIDDQQSGPITAQELKSLADSGQLKPTDEVWKEGMPDWVKAGTLKNLCPPAATVTSASTASASAAVSTSKTSAAHDPVQPRNTAPVTPAGEIRRDALTVAHEDDLEIEAPQARPSELYKQEEEQAKAAHAEARRERQTKKKDYLEYDEAFELGEQAKKVASDASRDALAAFKTMLRNPVGGLDEAFVQLGPNQAIAVGVVFALIFSACFFVGLNFLNASTAGFLLGTTGATGFVAFIKIGILSLLTPLGMLAGCAASRALFKGQGGFPSDVFLGGAALLPLAAFLLFDGLLGERASELSGIGLIFAACTTVLMLYSGSTRIHRAPEAVATIAVPIMMLLSLWIPRIVAGIMF